MGKNIIQVVDDTIAGAIVSIFGENFSKSGFGKGLKLIIEIIFVLIVLELVTRLLGLILIFLVS